MLGRSWRVRPDSEVAYRVGTAVNAVGGVGPVDEVGAGFKRDVDLFGAGFKHDVDLVGVGFKREVILVGAGTQGKGFAHVGGIGSDFDGDERGVPLTGICRDGCRAGYGNPEAQRATQAAALEKGYLDAAVLGSRHRGHQLRRLALLNLDGSWAAERCDDSDAPGIVCGAGENAKEQCCCEKYSCLHSFRRAEGGPERCGVKWIVHRATERSHTQDATDRRRHARETIRRGCEVSFGIVCVFTERETARRRHEHVSRRQRDSDVTRGSHTQPTHTALLLSGGAAYLSHYASGTRQIEDDTHERRGDTDVRHFARDQQPPRRGW